MSGIVMLPIGYPCPDCDEPLPIEAFYDTAEDDKSGHYRCKCGRDTSWAIVQTTTLDQLIKDYRE